MTKLKTSAPSTGAATLAASNELLTLKCCVFNKASVKSVAYAIGNANQQLAAVIAIASSAKQSNVRHGRLFFFVTRPAFHVDRGASEAKCNNVIVERSRNAVVAASNSNCVFSLETHSSSNIQNVSFCLLQALKRMLSSHCSFVCRIL